MLTTPNMLADVYYVFQPMFGRDGNIVAVECLTRLTDAPLPMEEFFRQISVTLRSQILLQQISLVEKHRSWFHQNDIIATVNVDESTLQILTDDAIIQWVRKIGCLHFEMNEFSESLVKSGSIINTLNKEYSLWMDDFGAGYAGFMALENNSFQNIKISKNLLWNLSAQNGGQDLMCALLNYFHVNNYKVVIEGVETLHYVSWLKDMPWFALQGYQWPEKRIDELITTPQRVKTEITL